MRALSLAAIGMLSAAFVASACGQSGAVDRFGGADADDASPVAESGRHDTGPEEVAFPDADPTLGGPCVDDGECARPVIACATFACDLALKRCRATPDDVKCDNGNFCDGVEKCDPRVGCIAGPVVDCDSHDGCVVDRCVEASKSCAHAPRDVDGDGDPPNVCAGGGDCDDHDPLVSSKVAEVCGNGRDDNCNGLIDESPCVAPVHTTCTDALVVAADGTFSIDLAGTSRSYAASCAASDAYVRQAVIAVQVLGSAPRDVQLRVDASGFGALGPVAIASDVLCGDPTTETRCAAFAAGATSGVLRLRAVAPGTYAVYLLSRDEVKVDLHVAFLAPTVPPTNLSCATIASGLDATTTSLSVVLPLAEAGTFASACAPTAGPLGYRVVVAAALAPLDLRVRATPLATGARAVIGLRNADCTTATSERTCGTGAPAESLFRALPAGTYVLTVGATAAVDVALEASLAPASASPADASCTGAPPLPLSATTLIDLAGHEKSIAATCLPADIGGPPTSADAAYSLVLGEPSDVLVFARSAGLASVALGLDAPACVAPALACAVGAPIRINKRALPAGDYRVVVESAPASKALVTAFARPTAPSGPVGADNCASPVVDIPASGGFFSGSTVGAKADFDASCDAAASTAGGAPDVVYRLFLPSQSRVVLDANGSAFATTLTLASGAACPGAPLADGCAAGFVGGNAFLDKVVAAGTYWILVDGYNLASGAYALDVRTAPAP